MKTSYAHRFAIAALAFALASGSTAQTTALFTKRAFVGSHYFLGFVLNTADWISVEATDDFSTWTPIASVATTNNVTEFVDKNAVERPLRFYRLVHPGVPVEEARTRWQPHSEGDYQFQLQHIRSHVGPYVLSATVTVVGGQKTISNAEADGQPLDQPDSLDFPSVEEMFAALKQAQQAGCWRVAVTYDAADGHPLWYVIERVIGIFPGKETDQFRISNLTHLTSGNGS
ncbi:MAG TPA: DUF6174 domain-containing protein [Verrucomicrobiota bacterium]|nr:hypothetical protein [Verrucomicrobiales bacterium]HRI16142.1 DUF6174 domain-containing protein [Verrucomicrobiota bacterium]